MTEEEVREVPMATAVHMAGHTTLLVGHTVVPTTLPGGHITPVAGRMVGRTTPAADHMIKGAASRHRHTEARIARHRITIIRIVIKTG